MLTRTGLVVAAMLALASCKRSAPHYTEPVKKQLGTLASTCEPTARGFYDAILWCHPSDDYSRASVRVMLTDKERIGQVHIRLVEPTVEAALAKLAPAIAGLVDREASDAIMADLRQAKPKAPSESPTPVAIKGMHVLAGIEQVKGEFEVLVMFDWDS